MATVTYFDPIHSGDRPLTGEVWSPGPAKRTLWVRTPDGQWVVVKMDTRTVVHNPPTDPRFDRCPGHWHYREDARDEWQPGDGPRLHCGRCWPEAARADYVRMFRTDRRDFTQAEHARFATLFQL